MNKVRILLIDPVEGYLDIKDNTPFPLNFSLGDIRDISKRNGSYSKTITLIGNKNNNDLLSHLYDVNIVNGTFNINALQTCLVEQDGIVILDNMYLQLTSVKKTQKSGTHDIEVEYEAQLKDSSSDFFTKIANLELDSKYIDSNGDEQRVIDLSAFNHPYNVTNITNSFTNTYTDGYKYLLPYIANSTEYDIKDLKPAIYTKILWDKIFDYAGYTYTFSEANGLDIQFEKLIHPYNGDVPKPIEDKTSWVIAEKTTVPVTYNLQEGGFPTQLQIYDNVIQDDNGYYNPGTGEYTLAFDLANNDSIQYEISIEYDFSITNNSGQNLTLTGTGTGIDYAVQYVVQKPVVNNTIIMGALFHVPQNTVLNNGSTYVLATNFEENITINKSNLITGDVLKNLLGPRPILLGDAITQKWKTSGGVILDMTMNLTVKSISVVIKPNLETFVLGSSITLNTFIPKKIKQSDFIKSICQMYNLFIERNPNDDKNLIIKTRDKFYDDGSVVDWTNQLAKDDEQELQFLPELSSKKLILSYKPDNDTPNINYQSIINETYGQLEFVFENDYVRNSERKELIFSPTPNTYTDFQANVPILIGLAPKTNLRILLDNGVASCLPYDIKETNTVTYTQTTYPFISHFDNAENPTFDINYGICDFYFYNPDSLTNNNLYNLHWRRTLSQINNGKLLTAKFNLSSVDIKKLKLNDKIRIDNSYWNINKVIDYDANSNNLTTVELISIDDDLVLPNINNFGVTVSNPTGEVILPAPGDTYLNDLGDPKNGGSNGPGLPTGPGKNRYEYLNIDMSNGLVGINGIYNQTSNLTEGNIYGDNNLVNAIGYTEVKGSNNIVNSPVLMYGNNNTIDENIENVFVFGRNGETFSETNTMYTNNINLSPGSTINLIPIEDLDIWEKTITTIDTDYSILNKDKGHVIDVTSNNCIIAGGVTNTISNSFGSAILGTNGVNVIADSNAATIVGGLLNNILNNSHGAIILGTQIATIDDGFHCAIISSVGGDIITSDNSVLIGGLNGVINGFDRSVILGGNGITAIASDTVYVPYLNIQTVPAGTPVKALGVEANGNVVEVAGLPTTSTWAQVLANGNVSGGTNPKLSSGDVLASTNGGGQLDLDYGGSPNIVVLSTDNGALTTAYLYIASSTVELTSGAGSSQILLNNDVNIFTTDKFQFNGRLNSISSIDIIKFIDNWSTSFITDNTDKPGIVIGSKNSTINNAVVNSVILGGTSHSLDASCNNNVILGGDQNRLTATAIGSAIIASTKLNGTYQYTLYQSDSYRDAGTHIVTTLNNTTTTLYSFLPDADGVWAIEWMVTAFRASTGDAMTSKSYRGFKVIAGVVTAMAAQTVDRKSDFPGAVTTLIDTDGTNIRLRVTGQAGATIDWKGSLTITK